jgi:hypothetical protein
MICFRYTNLKVENPSSAGKVSLIPYIMWSGDLDNLSPKRVPNTGCSSLIWAGISHTHWTQTYPHMEAFAKHFWHLWVTTKCWMRRDILADCATLGRFNLFSGIQSACTTWKVIYSTLPSPGNADYRRLIAMLLLLGLVL